MSQNDLRKYFRKPTPLGAICLLIFGIVFLLIARREGGLVLAGVGIAMAAVGILTISSGSKRSDPAVDAFCSSLSADYYAAKKSVVDSYGNTVDEALYSEGFNFSNLFRARLARKGKDNIWRSSIFEMSCIFFAAENVYYFNKKVSLITDEKSEQQKQFRVADIQMVSLEELNQSVAVAIAIPGNEKIYVNCKSRASAMELCDRIRGKMQKSK